MQRSIVSAVARQLYNSIFAVDGIKRNLIIPFECVIYGLDMFISEFENYVKKKEELMCDIWYCMYKDNILLFMDIFVYIVDYV